VIYTWCNRSWDVDGLRPDLWELLSDRQALVPDIRRQFAHARSGDKQFQHEASRRVYVSFIGGEGCPPQIAASITDQVVDGLVVKEGKSSGQFSVISRANQPTT
jgi:hypothetical protein